MPTLKDAMCKSSLFTRPLLLLLLLLVSSTQAYKPQCCPDGQFYSSDEKTCNDGSRIRLNCTDYFVFRPEDEPGSQRFFEDINGDWLQIENHVSYNISSKDYCVVKRETGVEEMMICFTDELVEARPTWNLMFYGAFSIISSVFLALTLLVYLVLPELREIQDKAMMSMVVSFMVAFFVTGKQQLDYSPVENAFTCVLLAFIMYYSFMCAFFWLNIISLNIWRSVWFPSFKIPSNLLFIVYSTIGWGMPLLFLAVMLFSYHTVAYEFVSPGFGESSCWFNGVYAMWVYFYGPMLVLLSMNLVYLSLTVWKLWHQYKDLNCSKLKILRYKCTMCLKLALIMGATWIFEILSFALGGIEGCWYVWILPDAMNALQGLLIFIIMVACRKRVRKLLAQRKPFNIPFPKSWAAYADIENCDPIGPEELELSQEA